MATRGVGGGRRLVAGAVVAGCTTAKVHDACQPRIPDKDRGPDHPAQFDLARRMRRRAVVCIVRTPAFTRSDAPIEDMTRVTRELSSSPVIG